jgi:indolepyruvate ferredoxin oxidoreductase
MKLAHVGLDDKYALETGRIYVTGTQALVRLPMLQRQRDAAAGLNTACFISGYRGSPLGIYDQALWRAKAFLKANHIHFEPGVNEDLAATAIWGSQQLNLFPGAKYDGVFGIWYGKGPGVDRSLDAFRHANFAGTSPHGGVLALAGDDHAAVSSTTAHQSEFNFQSVGMPMLHPATVQEYLDFGLIGIAMSRFAGVWVGLKCVTETAESSASVTLDPTALEIVMPQGVPFPPDGVHIRWPDAMLPQDLRLLDFKLPAAIAFARANKVDREVIAAPRRRLGIVSTGKSYLDVRQALDDLGISERQARDIGLSLYKVGMVWPLDPEGLRAFATGHDELLVVEEKRALIEPQIRDLLYALPDGQRPRIVGKQDADGARLLASDGELRPTVIAQAIARRLAPFHTSNPIADRLGFIAAKERQMAHPSPALERRPYFCSGCPHSSSTKVPEGSRALAGIGCHYLALGMDRSTATFSQMGGEGVAWIGQAPFTSEEHVFANIGDGTYYHSGLLAIRQAAASKVNITYKLLYNDAVAMTGGQPVDGPLTVADITLQLAGEGVKKIVVVSDEPEKYAKDARFADGVTVRHRDDLDAVQKELRDIQGCTVLIYDQTCAAEKRRRRSRGTFPDPDKRVFINSAVCEGCGDCSAKSNCVSIEPLETEFGRKRRINQSSCNKDFSCLNGFCPSFVTVEGAMIRRANATPDAAAQAAHEATLAGLPVPRAPGLTEPYNVLITGIGGTGVVTVGAVLAMAAHIEGFGVTVLDQTGLAQKNGAVMSHVRIGATPEVLHAVRIGAGGADLVLACDMVTAASNPALETMLAGHTTAVVNSHLAPTADFTLNTNIEFRESATKSAIRSACGKNQAVFFDGSRLATALMGDSIATNMFMLGDAFQRGLLPVSLQALLQAIEVNGASVEANKRAFAWGRQHAHDPRAVEAATGDDIGRSRPTAIAESLDEIVTHRSSHLTAWGSAAWAERYRSLVKKAELAETRRTKGVCGFADAVARNAAKLMSYKDEYEVARLYSDGSFMARLNAQFEGDFKISFHLAPPLFAPRDPNTGELKKLRFGAWMAPAFKLLVRLKGLRGSAFDPFGYSTERKAERRLIETYFDLINELCAKLAPENHALAVELACLPDAIRGFGHVKDRNMQAAKASEERLLAAFRAPKAHASAAE